MLIAIRLQWAVVGCNDEMSHLMKTLDIAQFVNAGNTVSTLLQTKKTYFRAPDSGLK